MALPEGEEEKFIAEKAAEGKPVENMTIKQLHADVKKYKQDKEAIGYELEGMQKINQSNVTRADKAEAKIQKLLVENEKLKKQPPQVIETVKTITPPNYVETVQRAEELQQQVDQLLEQNEQAQKTIDDLQEQVLEAVSKQGGPKIEFVDDVPADYAATKQELETLKAQQENLRVDMAISQNLNALGAAAKFLLDNQDRLTANLENFISADFTTDNIKQLAQLVTLLVNNVDGDFDI